MKLVLKKLCFPTIRHIWQHREQYAFSMNALYSILGIKKQGFHQMVDRWLKKESMRKQVIHMVQLIREDHPTMGVRDIYFKLRPSGIGRDGFECICRQEGLLSVRVKNWARTTDSSGVIRFEDLTKDLEIHRINQVWQSDITYFELQ